MSLADVTRLIQLGDSDLIAGGSEDSQVGIGGDSAGGQLAASVGHDVQGLAFQVNRKASCTLCTFKTETFAHYFKNIIITLT